MATAEKFSIRHTQAAPLEYDVVSGETLWAKCRTRPLADSVAAELTRIDDDRRRQRQAVDAEAGGGVARAEEARR